LRSFRQHVLASLPSKQERLLWKRGAEQDYCGSTTQSMDEAALGAIWTATRAGTRATVQDRIRAERAGRSPADMVEIPLTRKAEFHRWTQRARTELIFVPTEDYWWRVLDEDFRPHLAPGDLFFFGSRCEIPDHPHPTPTRARNILTGYVSNAGNWRGHRDSMVVLRQNRDPPLALPQPKAGQAQINPLWQVPSAPSAPHLEPAGVLLVPGLHSAPLLQWTPPPPPPLPASIEESPVPSPPPPPPPPGTIVDLPSVEGFVVGQAVGASTVIPSPAQAKTRCFSMVWQPPDLTERLVAQKTTAGNERQ